MEIEALTNASYVGEFTMCFQHSLNIGRRKVCESNYPVRISSTASHGRPPKRWAEKKSKKMPGLNPGHEKTDRQRALMLADTHATQPTAYVKTHNTENLLH